MTTIPASAADYNVSHSDKLMKKVKDAPFVPIGKSYFHCFMLRLEYSSRIKVNIMAAGTLVAQGAKIINSHGIDYRIPSSL